MAFFAARQPILDVKKNVYGYELLFRSSTDNAFPNVDPEKATSKMIESLQFNLGLDKISEDKYAFINFTEDSILNNYPQLLPKQKVVIEILETVEPTPPVLLKLSELSKQGYILALDDYVHDARWEKFYPQCHIIKVDCLSISTDELANIGKIKKKYPHLKLLAEKVESYEQYKQYINIGFELFQGYFFSKPEVVRNVQINTSNAVLSSLLAEISKKDININSISSMIEHDVALSFKLLRYTQSPLFRRGKKIENIKQAVIMLGQSELQRFVMFLLAASFGENKPSELIRLSMQRAKFCEQFALLISKQEQVSSAFLVGMLSLIDAMLDAKLPLVIGEMPLSDNIKKALLSNEGALAEAIKISKLIENGNWAKIDKVCALHNIDYELLMKTYDDAAVWADERLSLML